jgi:hypothetical protein
MTDVLTKREVLTQRQTCIEGRLHEEMDKEDGIYSPKKEQVCSSQSSKRNNPTGTLILNFIL